MNKNKKIIFYFILFFFQNNFLFAKDAWIGIYVNYNTLELKKHYSLITEKGLLVSIVYKKSPADIAGLKAGDIIISANKKDANVKMFNFENILNDKNPGDIIELEVLRSSNENKIFKITVGDKKNSNALGEITQESEKFATYLYWPGWFIKQPDEKISKIYSLINPELVKKYDTKNHIITCIDKRSDIYKKGVKLYDELLTINDQPAYLYEYSNKPFNITIKRDSKILTFRNIFPIIKKESEFDFMCVPEFADAICSKLLWANNYDDKGETDSKLIRKNNLDIYECCEKNNVAYLPFLEINEGKSLRLDFFRFFLGDLILYKDNKSSERSQLDKHIKIAESELKKIETVKKKYPDYKLPESYYEVVDLLTKTNLYSKGFKDDVVIDYKKEENIERLKTIINEKVKSDIKNINTLKLIETRSYFLIQSEEYEYLEDIIIKAISDNYSQDSDEYIKLLGKFYSTLAEIYYKQSNIQKLKKINLDAQNWLKKKPTSIHVKLINKNFLTNVYHSTMMMDTKDFIKQFTGNDWKKIDNYLNEFYLLSAQDQKTILEIDKDYLYDGYSSLAFQRSWLNFSDKRYDYYHLKALELIDLNPTKREHRKIYIYASLLNAANLNNDEIIINKILLDVKRFLIEAKGNDDHLVAIGNNLGNLYNFYSSKSLYAELEELLISYEKLFSTDASKKKPGGQINDFFYFYAKSDIERNKNKYDKSVNYLEKIVNMPQHNLSNIFSELRKNNNIDLMKQVTLMNILPDLFDGYYKTGNFKKIKEITLEGLGVQIDDVNYKNLEDILIVLHPIRVLNPLLSYYLRENNIEKANMVAKFIDDNLDKITKQNLSAENQKKPDDFTYNANDLIKINQKRLAYDLYNKANDLVLKGYNDIFYNSIWRTTSNDINSAVDFLEGSKLINSEDFFSKAYNTSQIIKNSNFSREILKAYISKKNQENPELTKYHNIQSELISLIKMEELKLTRSADKVTQSAFKKDFDFKKNEFNLIEDKIRITNPEYFKTIRVEGVKLQEIQNKLKPNQAVLDYYFSENKLAVVIIKNSSYDVHIENISLNNLQNIKNNIRNTLQISRNGNLIPYDIKSGYRLNEIVFLNLVKYLKNINYLYIVPHGPLNEIPIHVLPKTNGINCIDCSLVNWNFSDYTFNYLPSLDAFQGPGNDEFFTKILKENFKQAYNQFDSNRNLKKIKDSAIDLFDNVLKSTEDKKKKEVIHDFSKIKYLGIGDPDLYAKSVKKDKIVENLNLERFMVLRSLNLSSNTRSINIADFYSPLKSSREEILYAVKTFGEENSVTWLRENATESKIKETDLSKFNIIHFATHAEVSGAMKGLNEPFLVLSPPKEKKDIDNGLLMMNEIMQLNLNADLVILSACNTGSVEDQYAGSYSGLAKAFFVAGAKSVLVSNWYVEDTATQRLIIKFVENISKNKGNFAENLNLTMKELSKQNNQYSHPIFWAPFVLVGGSD